MVFGNWRVYFNRREAFPHIWSVDQGESESEICVQWVRFDRCKLRSATSLTSPDKEHAVSQPIAWLWLCARAEFTNGGVVFHGD